MSQPPPPHPLPTAQWREGIDGDALNLKLPVWRGFPPGVVIEAIAWHESSGNPGAIHVDRPGWLTTSFGLFQVEGATVLSLVPGFSDPTVLFHPLFNRAVALRRLEQLVQEFGQDSDAHFDRVIAGYNGGEGWGAQYTKTPENYGPDPLVLNDQVYVNAILAACVVVSTDRSMK